MELPGANYLFALAAVSITFAAFSALLLIFRQASSTIVWRLSSLVMAVPVLAFVVTLPRRRRAAGHHRVPRYVWTLLFVQLVIVAYLVMNAIGTPIETGPAAYAAAMTGLLFSSGIADVVALAAALGEPSMRSS